MVRLDVYTWNIAARQEEIMVDLIDDVAQKVQVISIPQANASIARNTGIEHVTTPYVYLIDDDNTFCETFFSQSLAEYQYYAWTYQQNIIYSPTIMYRDTWRIQSLWIKTFHFLVWRPEPVLSHGWKKKIVEKLRFLFPLPKSYLDAEHYVQPMLIWWNSLLAPTKLLLEYAFDISMAFVYEDLDMIYSITNNNIPLIVSKYTKISHMERDKTNLESSFLATPAGAYQKAKNRLLFVRKHGTLLQRIAFFCVWFPLTTLMTSVRILLVWSAQRYAILRSYYKGIKIWLLMKI